MLLFYPVQAEEFHVLHRLKTNPLFASHSKHLSETFKYIFLGVSFSSNFRIAFFAINTAISLFIWLNKTTSSSLFLNSGEKILSTSLVIALLSICSIFKTDHFLPISLAPAFEVMIRITFLKSAFLPLLSVKVA